MTNKSNAQMGHSSSCSRGISANPALVTESHQTSDGRRGSLPRLAPLHTHMNLSRTGGTSIPFYITCIIFYVDRARSRSGDNHPR